MTDDITALVAAALTQANEDSHPSDGYGVGFASAFIAALAAKGLTVAPVGGLDAAWKAAEAALPEGTRLVLWQDKDGPQYLQVLAPSEPDCEHDDDTMKPIAARLAAYPSKGLGDLVGAFRSIAADPVLARLRASGETDREEPA